jgi:putative ABC transport system permease protein
MVRLAVAQIRARPASFVALAATALLAVGTITLVSSLIAADVAAPAAAAATASADEASLGTIAGIFGEGAILVSLLVMVNCVGFAVRHQLRDLALLRTIAATPRQVHRLVRWEALVVVATVAPAGWLAGNVGARWFLDALVRHGYSAPDVVVPGGLLPVLTAAISLVATGLIAVVASALGVRRITRLSPAAALGDSATERRGIGWIRSVVGLLAIADAAALIGVNVAAGGTDAVDGAFLALLVLMAAVGLLGPVAARMVAALLGVVPRRLWPRIGWLADANVRGHARRLASAVVPIALLVALAGNFLFVGPTIEHAAHPDASSELDGFSDPNENWLRLVELGMFVLLAAVAVVNTLVALTAERRRELRLLGLLGATADDLWRMLVVETGLIVLVGLVLGGSVAAVTLSTFSLGATGSPLPSVPMASVAAIVGATVALAAPSILVTGRWALSADGDPAVLDDPGPGPDEADISSRRGHVAATRPVG